MYMATRSTLHPGQAKNIAFIGQKGIPAEFVGTSGVEFYVENRAGQLTRKGVRVDCYVRSWATPRQKTSYRGIKLIHLPTINTKHLDATIHSFLSSVHVCFTKADTVWYQAIGPAFFSFIPRLAGKNIMTTIHGLDWKRDKWGWLAKKLLRFSERIAVANTHQLIVVSNELRLYYKQTYGRDSVVNPPTVRARRTVLPDIITRKYKLKGNDYILYMGRFVPEKRIEWLIRAYQSLRPAGTKLVLAGGSSHSRRYVEFLKRLAHGMRGIIFTDFVLGQEKRELLSNCALFVLPSSLEGSPTVICELPADRTALVSTGVVRNIKRRAVYSFLTNSKEDFVKQLHVLLQLAEQN